MAETEKSKSKPRTPIIEPTNNVLKQLLAQEPKIDKNQSRVDALIGVAAVDAQLQQLLIVRLTPSTDDEDELLKEGRPLGSFMLRAKLARRLGLISPDLYSILKVLSEIRNICAHSERREDVFNDQSVRQRVENLWSRVSKDLKHDENTVEEKFNSLCEIIKFSLSFRLRSIIPLTTANSEFFFIEPRTKP